MKVDVDDISFSTLLLGVAVLLTVVSSLYRDMPSLTSWTVLAFLATLSLLRTDFVNIRFSEQFRAAVEIENEFVSN